LYIRFLHLPMKLDWDASIIKNIPITERVRFQMRAEFFIAESQTCPPASTSENERAQLGEGWNQNSASRISS
jgi:hypothetical protein